MELLCMHGNSFLLHETCPAKRQQRLSSFINELWHAKYFALINLNLKLPFSSIANFSHLLIHLDWECQSKVNWDPQLQQTADPSFYLRNLIKFKLVITNSHLARKNQNWKEDNFCQPRTLKIRFNYGALGKIEILIFFLSLGKIKKICFP